MTIYVNRAWDAQAGPGFVRWRTAGPDIGGQFYPGPGTFSVDTSDPMVEQVIETADPLPAQLHSNTSPIGSVISHWPLNGDYLDVVGGINLTAAGTVPGVVGIPGSGTEAMQFHANARLDSPQSAASDPLRLLGEMTLECLIFPFEYVTDAGGIFASFANSSGGFATATAANNFLWSLGLLQTTNELYYYHEDIGTGGHAINSGVFIPPGVWSHVAFTRDTLGTFVRFYVNGTLVHRETALQPPASGTSSHVQAGGNETDARKYPGIISSMRVIDAELRPEHILADARLTLPPELRP